MATFAADNISVRVSISQNTRRGGYNDSLYYSRDEFDKLTDKEVQAAIDERVNSWLTFCDKQATIVPVDPSDDELKAQKTEYERLIAEIDEKLAN